MTDEVRDLDPAVPASVPGAQAEPKTEDKATPPETPPANGQEQEAAPENSASEAETATDENQDEPPAEDEDETDGEKPKKLSRSQRERRAKIRALERAEFAEREAAELRRQLGERGQPGQQQQAAIDPNDPEPRVDDYQSTIDPAGFHKLAHDAWKVRQAERQSRQDFQKSDSERRQADIRRELAEAHIDREEEARERIADYDNVLRSAQTEVSRHVGDLILHSDKSALLAYHMAKHPDVLRDLNQRTPLDAARAIGRIEARLSLPQAKKTTTAPPPLKPPSGGGASPPTDIRKLADMDDITAYAKARDGKKG